VHSDSCRHWWGWAGCCISGAACRPSRRRRVLRRRLPAAPTAVRPTVAVFNMAAVMRDYDKAKYQVHLLNKMRIDRSGRLVTMRGEAAKLTELVRNSVDPAAKERYSKDLTTLERNFQDEQQAVGKMLNDEASKVISKLYDEIKMVVDKTAEMNAYHIVFAYPDAVTAEEQSNPFFKEMKLKPPAAQPFYVSKQVDITGVVIQTLNAWYAPVDEKGQKVDVTKLPQLELPTAPGTGAVGGAGSPLPGAPATGVPKP
jgi:Skp family chaperone for outer membrane proteins